MDNVLLRISRAQSQLLRDVQFAEDDALWKYSHAIKGARIAPADAAAIANAVVALLCAQSSRVLVDVENSSAAMKRIERALRCARAKKSPPQWSGSKADFSRRNNRFTTTRSKKDQSHGC